MVETTGISMSTLQAEALEGLRQKWGWMLALGILFIVLGTIGLGMAFALTLASVLFFGVLLLVGGGAQLVGAFQTKGWKSTLWNILIALVYIGAGALVIYDPVGTSIALTLVIAAALVAIGVLRIIMAFQLRRARGWWWPLVAGIASIILGGMIYANLPVSGLWVIGLLVAIEMIFHGWSYVIVALAARSVTQEEAAASDAAPAAKA
jgi:uncharacterized membrane protein HdeD (DUF308 family)